MGQGKSVPQIEKDHTVYDLVVIGGGPMGLSTAWQASSQGKKVLVLERYVYFNGSGSSGDLVRMFRTMYTEDFMADLAFQARDCWKKLEEAAGEKLIEMTGLLNFGNPNYVAGPEGNLLGPVRNLYRHKMPFQKLNAAQIQEQLPFENLPDSYIGLYAPDNGCINTRRVLESLFSLCKKNGCELREDARVLKIDTNEEGCCVLATINGKQETFYTKKCAITAGAFTNHILEPSFGFSLNLDIWEMVYQYFSISPSAKKPGNPDAPEGTIERLEGKPFKCMWFQFENDSDEHNPNSSSLFYGFPSVPWAPNNTARIAVDHASRRISDPSHRSPDVNDYDMRRTTEYIRKHMPSLVAFPYFQGVCLQTNVPDNMFVLDYVPETHKNVVLFTAGWGFKFVPLIGEVLANLCFPCSSTPSYDISHFRIDRPGVIKAKDILPTAVLKLAPSGSSMHKTPSPSAIQLLKIRSSDSLQKRDTKIVIQKTPDNEWPISKLTNSNNNNNNNNNLSFERGKQVHHEGSEHNYRERASRAWLREFASRHPQRRVQFLASLQSLPEKRAPSDLGKILIVGAGVAGLYAGMILKSLGISNFKIIEAEAEHIGGRVRTHHFRNSQFVDDPENPEFWDYIDIGAMRFPQISVMQRVFDLVDTLNDHNKQNSKRPIEWLKYYLTDQQENQLLYFNGISRRYSQVQHTDEDLNFGVSRGGNVPDDFTRGKVYSYWTNLAYEHLLKKLTSNFDAGFEELMKYDHFTTRTYLASFLTSEKYPDDHYLQRSSTLVGHYPQTVIDWLETRDSGTGNFEKAFSESIIDALDFAGCEWKCIAGGTGRLVDGMVSYVGREKIHMGERLLKISKGTDRATPVRAEIHVGLEKQTEEFHHMICTLPFGVLRTVDTSEIALSYEKRTAMRSLFYDHSTKVAIRFKYRFWETGQFPIFGGVSTTDLPARVIVYPSYGFGKQDAPGVILASYTWGQDADRMGSMDPQKAILLCIDNLKTIHGAEQVERALEGFDVTQDAVAWNWNTSENALGAFALYGAGQFRDLFLGAIQPEMDNHLHFCGEALSVHHAWIVGSLNSAYRSVREIIQDNPQLLHKMEELWGKIEDVEYGNF